MNIMMGKDSLGFTAFLQVTLLLIPGIALIYFYNRYPSKMFVGDTGTLSMGAIIGVLSIIYRLEISGVLFLLLPITNSFVSLSIFGGLFERSELKERPIIVEKDGTLKPNESKQAPITLTRIVLLFGYRREREVINFYVTINLILLFFGVLSYLLVM
jgi:UDP-N-acetylglucosamine--dolichyl-phosphate N-acetylglucosaminephosphotransferase